MSTTVTFNAEYTRDGQVWTRIPEADYDINCRAWAVLLTGRGGEKPFTPLGQSGYPENLDPATAALQLDMDGEFGTDSPYWFTLADVDRLMESDEDFTMARYDYDKSLTLDVAEPTLTAARDHRRKAGLLDSQVRIIAVLS